MIEAHRNHVPSETIPVSLNLADRRRLSSVDTLLPIALHFRRWLVLVLVIVPGLLPLTNLLLGDLRCRRRRGRDRDRLSLNGTLLRLQLLLLFTPVLLLLFPDLLLRSLLLLLLLKGLDFRRSA